MTPDLIIKHFKQPKEYFIIFTKTELALYIKIKDIVFASERINLSNFNEKYDIMNSNFEEIHYTIFDKNKETFGVKQLSVLHFVNAKYILNDFVEYFV